MQVLGGLGCRVEGFRAKGFGVLGFSGLRSTQYKIATSHFPQNTVDGVDLVFRIPRIL